VESASLPRTDEIAFKQNNLHERARKLVFAIVKRLGISTAFRSFSVSVPRVADLVMLKTSTGRAGQQVMACERTMLETID
jgi:hypothetical protein